MSEQGIRSQEEVSADIERVLAAGSFGKWTRFTLAALGGIPFIGPLLGAGGQLWGEIDQGHNNRLLREYIEAMRGQVNRIGIKLVEITSRLDSVYDQYKPRIESDDFLDMTRKAFRVIANSDTDEKREFVRKLLCNAATTSITSDDVVRLFIDWIAVSIWLGEPSASSAANRICACLIRRTSAFPLARISCNCTRSSASSVIRHFFISKLLPATDASCIS